MHRVTAVVGLMGVLVGAGIAAGYGFWSTRRKELEAAVVAATMVREAMTLAVEVLEESGASEQSVSRLARLESLWFDQRAALVLYLLPNQFSMLNRAVAIAGESSARGTLSEDRRVQVVDNVKATLEWLEPRAEELRDAHQAFILTPLWKYLKSRPWRPQPVRNP